MEDRPAYFASRQNVERARFQQTHQSRSWMCAECNRQPSRHDLTCELMCCGWWACQEAISAQSDGQVLVRIASPGQVLASLQVSHRSSHHHK